MVARKIDTANGRKCTGCKALKPRNAFHNSKTSAGGIDSRCKKCRYEMRRTWAKKNPAKIAEQNKRWRKNDPSRARDHHLKTNYGAPLGTYDKLFHEQRGRCAICLSNKPSGKGTFHLDHSHSTGKIRGLLCHHCNCALGHLSEDLTLFRNAVSYLARHS